MTASAAAEAGQERDARHVRRLAHDLRGLFAARVVDRRVGAIRVRGHQHGGPARGQDAARDRLERADSDQREAAREREHLRENDADAGAGVRTRSDPGGDEIGARAPGRLEHRDDARVEQVAAPHPGIETSLRHVSPPRSSATDPAAPEVSIARISASRFIMPGAPASRRSRGAKPPSARRACARIARSRRASTIPASPNPACFPSSAAMRSEGTYSRSKSAAPMTIQTGAPGRVTR